MHLFWQLAINFGPILLLIVVFAYLVKYGRKKQLDYLEFSKGCMSEHLAEMRRLNDKLERIALLLDVERGYHSNDILRT